MTPRLVVRPQAEAELLEARDWFNRQRPGLGQEFAAEVDLTRSWSSESSTEAGIRNGGASASEAPLYGKWEKYKKLADPVST